MLQSLTPRLPISTGLMYFAYFLLINIVTTLCKVMIITTSAISIVLAVSLLCRTSKYFLFKIFISFCTKSGRKPKRITWPLRRDDAGYREASQVKEMSLPWPRPLTVEARVRPQVSPCEILAAKSDTETDFSPSFTLSMSLHQCRILTFHSSASDVT